MLGKGHGGLYRVYGACRKKEGSEMLREEGDKIKFIHFRLYRWQVVVFKKESKQCSRNCTF